METYQRLQALLQQILVRFCDGNKAELARRLQKDASYINRLFYPPTKAGAKGIGQEIMEATKKAFPLPVGFWDMDASDVFTGTPGDDRPAPRSKIEHSPHDLIMRLGELMRPLSKTRREAIKPLLIELASTPENAEEMAKLFADIVSSGSM